MANFLGTVKLLVTEALYLGERGRGWFVSTKMTFTIVQEP